jgi:riboflavin synthase
VFTGIVRELGTVQRAEPSNGGMRLEIGADAIPRTVEIGASVSIDGCCLTVTSSNGGVIAFHAVPETLRRSTLGSLRAGRRVNLEPAVVAGEPLGGHYVQGHVDAVGRVRSVAREGEGVRMWIDAPPEVLRYCVEKGSVAVAGVSLTIAELDAAGFAVALVPHTLSVTTLGALAAGDEVNLEADVLAKYVERLLAR